jgi:hypothetical protein
MDNSQKALIVLTRHCHPIEILRRIVGLFVNNALELVWEEGSVTQFNVLPRKFSGGTEKRHEILRL